MLRRYLQRYGMAMHNPDPYFKPLDCKLIIWSVFDLQDMEFKVFLDDGYNYKIDHGAEQGLKRFRFELFGPPASNCARTIKNLWFIPYRINQLSSQHIFYDERPPGVSNVPPKYRLHQGQILDARAAKLREAEQWKKEANELREPSLSDSPGLFPIERRIPLARALSSTRSSERLMRSSMNGESVGVKSHCPRTTPSHATISHRKRQKHSSKFSKTN